MQRTQLCILVGKHNLRSSTMFTPASGRLPPFPWHQDSINVDVVRERRSRSHAGAEATMPYFRVQAGTSDSIFLWSSLRPGRTYLVVADVFGVLNPGPGLNWMKEVESMFPIKAAAMQFQEYIRFPAGADLDRRIAYCNFKIAEVREELQESDNDYDDEAIDELLER